jgi:hypothetical protein
MMRLVEREGLEPSTTEREDQDLSTSAETEVKITGWFFSMSARADRRHDVRFAGGGPADQADVGRAGEELPAQELADLAPPQCGITMGGVLECIRVLFAGESPP